jgi:hypothetical protein
MDDKYTECTVNLSLDLAPRQPILEAGATKFFLDGRELSTYKRDDGVIYIIGTKGVAGSMDLVATDKYNTLLRNGK